MISLLSFTAPPTWSSPIITSFAASPSTSDHLGLSSYGISPKVGIPCGYTCTSSRLIVPATTFTGDLSFYIGEEAHANELTCELHGKLLPNETIAAIGWELFDWSREGSLGRQARYAPLCGRKIMT
jgi:hypothetical protein